MFIYLPDEVCAHCFDETKCPLMNGSEDTLLLLLMPGRGGAGRLNGLYLRGGGLGTFVAELASVIISAINFEAFFLSLYL